MPNDNSKAPQQPGLFPGITAAAARRPIIPAMDQRPKTGNLPLFTGIPDTVYMPPANPNIKTTLDLRNPDTASQLKAAAAAERK